jgi:hypothetical protein
MNRLIQQVKDLLEAADPDISVIECASPPHSTPPNDSHVEAGLNQPAEAPETKDE